MQREAHDVISQAFAGRALSVQEVKREAIDRAARGASLEWRNAFRQALEKVARERLRFTADPVWKVFEQDFRDWQSAHPRAAGAVVLRAMKDGVIVKVVNMFWNSKRRSCHGRPIQVYQSTIFK